MLDIRWKTAQGQVLELHEMTDEHLYNSIRYCEIRARQGHNVSDYTANEHALYYLRLEDKRRRDEKEKKDK